MQERLKRAKNEYVILAGSSLFHYEWSLRVRDCVQCGTPIFKGKWRSRRKDRQAMLRGDASRPARPSLSTITADFQTPIGISTLTSLLIIDLLALPWLPRIRADAL